MLGKEQLSTHRIFLERFYSMIDRSQVHMGQFSIGSGCEIRKALIDKHVKIGNHVKLINQCGYDSYESGPIYIRDGILIVTRGAVIPDHFIL